MSKAIAVAVAGPAVVMAAAMMGAVWLAKKAWDKGRGFAATLSPADRAFLLPLGADKERWNLETATVRYEPFAGLDFGQTVPALRTLSQTSLPLPSTQGVEQEAFGTQVREALLNQVERVALTAGFRTERRALPPGASVLVFDLIQSGRPRELAPAQASRRPS